MWNNILAQLFESMPVCLFILIFCLSGQSMSGILESRAFPLFRNILVAADQPLLAGTLPQITTLDTIGHFLKISPSE